jgi:hypothetical protein
MAAEKREEKKGNLQSAGGDGDGNIGHHQC